MLGKVYIAIPFVLLLSCDDPAPKGEGSYKEEEQIKKVLSSLDADDPHQKLPDDYYWGKTGNGEPYIITGTDSHKGGGALGILFSDGTIFTHFCHVCGPGPTPLEGFRGETKDDVIASIKEAVGH